MADDRRAAAQTLEAEALSGQGDGLNALRAVEAARRMRDGELTSETLVKACLEHIEATEE